MPKSTTASECSTRSRANSNRRRSYLEKAIALRPDYAEALNNLGVLFVRGQNFARAEEQFKAGIRVAPQFDQPYLNLARLYAMQNDRQKAREVLLDLLRVQPVTPRQNKLWRCCNDAILANLRHHRMHESAGVPVVLAPDQT